MKKDQMKTETESVGMEKNTRKESIKKFFKNYILVFVLVIVLALGSIVTIWASRKNDSLKKDEESSTTLNNALESDGATKTVTEIVTSTIMETEVVTATESDGKLVTKIIETPKVVTTIKTVKTDAKGSDNDNADTTKKATTTKKAAETTTKKSSPTTTTTTKRPVPTTHKETAKYYSSLTKADMEEVKQYAISYIRKKGYKVEPQITWSNSTWSSVVGIDDDLSKYGNKFKVGVGISPVEWAKADIKDAVDSEIQSTEQANGPGSVAGVYPLVRHQDGGWEWTVGVW